MNYSNQFQAESENKLSNFTIPTKTSHNGQNNQETFQSPLTFSEDVTPKNFNPTFKNNGNKFNQNNSAGFFNNPANILLQPPPPPPPSGSADETPSLKRKYLGIDDPALPAELVKLMLPLQCQLCDVKLNSTSSAQMHYQSKNHDKKVNVWLQDWSKKTGEPVPKRKKIIKPDTPVGPNAYHCDICDLALTSMQHAQQHYSGKKHRAVFFGQANPSGSGYYNSEGKWIRTISDAKDKILCRIEFSDHQTFVLLTQDGLKFVQKTEKQLPVKLIAPATTLPKKQTSTSTVIDPAKYCTVCDIYASKDSIMKQHLDGYKHAKKMRNLNNKLQSANSTVPPPQQKSMKVSKLLKGSFCDVEVNSVKTAEQHYQSTHKKKREFQNGSETTAEQEVITRKLDESRVYNFKIRDSILDAKKPSLVNPAEGSSKIPPQDVDAGLKTPPQIADDASEAPLEIADELPLKSLSEATTSHTPTVIDSTAQCSGTTSKTGFSTEIRS